MKAKHIMDSDIIEEPLCLAIQKIHLLDIQWQWHNLEGSFSHPIQEIQPFYVQYNDNNTKEGSPSFLVEGS